MKEALRRAIAIRDGINRKTGYFDTNITDGVNHLLTDDRRVFTPQLQIIPNQDDCEVSFGRREDYIDEYYEYIESSGTQYIQLDYYMTPGSRVVADIQFLETIRQSRIIATQYNNSNYSTYEFYINGSGYWATGHKNGDGDWTASSVVADTNRHIFDYWANHYYKIDNGTVLDGTFTNTTTHNSYYPIRIFLQSPAQSGSYAYSKGRIFGYEIYDDNEIKVRDCKPCHDSLTNSYGLFDPLTRMFYPNAGSGSFTPGPIISGGN